MDMELILEEVRRDVFVHPKPQIDLDYLYSVKRELQKFSDDTNSQLKKNVYQNYSLFIDSSKAIATLKEEMRHLSLLLEQQQSSMNKLLDQINKAPIIQAALERSDTRAGDLFANLDTIDSNEAEHAEILPEWLVKSPEDFDVMIAQRNLKEAVELAKRVKEHLTEYPRCYDNQRDLKAKIEFRIQELINVICAELQPATERSVQGGPRSSISSIKLLRQLNLSSRATKLYFDLKSSTLRFVLDQQKFASSTTLQHIKQICSLFFHTTIEACNEFKQAFDLDNSINKAIDECDYICEPTVNKNSAGQTLYFDLVRPIYLTEHPKVAMKSSFSNGNDISSQILSAHNSKVTDDTIMATRPHYRTFSLLSTYASLTYWVTLEFENFVALIRMHVFSKYPPLSLTIIAESMSFLRNQCTRMALHSEIDISQHLERELKDDIRRVIEESSKKLIETVKKLDAEELWQYQLFRSKAEKCRFFEEMSDVGLKTMPSYMQNESRLPFTASKTAFARCYLLLINDLAKLVSPLNKSLIDNVLAKAFELQMESVMDAMSNAKHVSDARLVKANSNFLLSKVVSVAEEKYQTITNLKFYKLTDIKTKYAAKAETVAKLRNI